VTGSEQSRLDVGIVTIQELFGANELKIPDYQRPYKWSRKHVLQLMDDLLFHQNKSRFRIGSVVLHKAEYQDALNIVDGQQRIVTLGLILYVLDVENHNPLMQEDFNKLLLAQSISRENIQNNYAAIKQRFGSLDKHGKNSLKDFILKKCEVVKVVLNDISEAFQFFDSQNSRGKSLEPYDLLKAFHLREMQGNSEEERMLCVKTWEKAASEGKLKELFDNYLFRLRAWHRKQSGMYFSRDNIELFKGVTLSREQSYPYLQRYKMIEYAVNNPLADIAYPFQLNQVIINGKRFFEYVEHYLEACEQITVFDADKALDFGKDIEDIKEMFNVLATYNGRHRTGDQYTKNLFLAALLTYRDKFGDAEIEDAVKLCFRWSYAIRLENYAVRLATMDNKALEKNSLLHCIDMALTPQDVLSYAVPRIEEKRKGLEEVKRLFLAGDIINDE